MSFQQHLTEGRYSVSPFETLRSLMTWERHFRVPRVEQSSEDEFSTELLKLMAFEPFDTACLAPCGWRVGKPRLDLQARLSMRGVLSLWAAVPGQAFRSASSGRLTCDDFSDFEVHDGVPQLRLFELDLARLLDGLTEGPVVPLSEEAMRYGESLPETSAAAQREAVFHAYEYVVQRLALYFKCTIVCALVKLGRANELVVRRVSDRTDEVEYANLLPFDGKLWHPGLEAAAKALAMTPQQALRLYEEKLRHVPVSEQVRMCRELAGERLSWRDGHGAQPWAVAVLRVVSNPQEYPPLTASNAAAARQALRALAQSLGEATGTAKALTDGATAVEKGDSSKGKAENAFLCRLVQCYALTLDQAKDILELVDPQRWQDLPRDGLELAQVLAKLRASERHDSPAAVHFRAQVLALAQAEWTARSAARWDVRARGVARVFGCRDLDGLYAWADGEAPALRPWLETELQSLQKKSARKKPPSQR